MYMACITFGFEFNGCKGSLMAIGVIDAHGTPIPLDRAGSSHSHRGLSRLEIQPWDLKASPGFDAWIQEWCATVKARIWAYRGDELVRTLVALADLNYKPSMEWMTTLSNFIQ